MNKIVIVVLIAIVVVFFVFVGVGSFKSETKRNPKDVEAPPGSAGFSNLFGALQEKVVLKCEQKSPASSGRQCEKLPTGNINIPPAADSSVPFLGKSAFRTAKLVLIEGRASVSYMDKKGGGDEFDNPQKFDLPNPDNDNSRTESIVIREDGGTLNISCRGNSSCRVGQQ